MMKRAEKGQELEDLNLQMMHRLVSSTPSQAIFPFADRARAADPWPRARAPRRAGRWKPVPAASVYRGAVPVRWIRREEKNGRWQEAATSTFSIG
jgi:hypothetical protein